MPTLNKLEYLDETKKEIKNALNTNFNSGITDEDTFRSYVGKINNIYTNWTKVTGEGTEITLNNTKKGKMALTPKGNTEQNGTPTPDSPVPIQNVTGLQNIEVCGKNLFNKQEIIDNEAYLNKFNVSNLTTNNSGISWEATGNDSYISLSATITGGYGMYIEVEENTQYTLSFNSNYELTNYIHYIKGDYTFISRNNSLGHNSNVSFTTPSNCRYIFIRFGAQNQTGNTINITNIQIEKGAGTPYEAYQNQTYPINLGTMELCKMDDYQDYIYKSNGNWYLHQEIGKVVLDGSENITNPSNTGYSNTILRFNITVADKKYGKSGTIVDDILSNNFTCEKLDYDARTSESVAGHAAEHIVIIFIDKSRLSTENVQGFKTWLSTHNTMVYYVLATPTNTEITDTTLIEQLNSLSNATSYDDVTNISTEGNLAVVISVSALMKGGN